MKKTKNTKSDVRVPFVDLSESTNAIHEAYLDELNAFLERGSFVLTPEITAFEKDWALKIGTKFAVGTSSGADALYLSFRVLDIGQGDEVIVQGNAYNASVTAILRVGATPRFVDIDGETLGINTTLIKSALNNNTRAILPVHLYGAPNDMKIISEIATEHNLRVVEDCAQAHTATFLNKPVGSLGDCGAFSFYPTKNLGAFGEAGAITTNDDMLYKKAVAIRNLGEETKNVHTYLGYNMRLDAMQAIALSLKLKFLKESTEKRIEAARRYDELIRKAGVPVMPQKVPTDGTHVYHLYVVKLLTGDRDIVREILLKRGVQTAVHYPTPVYRQPFYDSVVDSCPITDQVSQQIISLPLFPSITGEQQEYVIHSLKESLARS